MVKIVFYSSLKNMTDYYNFPTFQHLQKRNFYYKIETNYSPPAYQDLRRKNPSRKTLSETENRQSQT